jgi:hypothetical protein
MEDASLIQHRFLCAESPTVPDAIKMVNAFNVRLDFSSMQTPVSTHAHTQQTQSTECANAQQESFTKIHASQAVQTGSQPSQEHVKNAMHPAGNAASK